MIGSVLALTLALAMVGSDGPSRTMPEPFQGLWTRDGSGCDDFESDQLMEVLDVRLQFYEAGADFTAVQTTGALSVRFHGDWWDINKTDENDLPIPWTNSAELTLSPDRTRLTLAIEGEHTPYVRCPEH